MKNKRNAPNKLNNYKQQNKKRKISEPVQDEKIIETSERRRHEITEIVTTENELYSNSQNSRMTNDVESKEVDYPSSEDDLNEEEKQNFENFKKKERQREIDELIVISKKKALKALKMLEETVKKTKKKLKNEEIDLKKSCSAVMLDSEDEEEAEDGDSSMYILEYIRTCILTHNWDKLTDLLLLLLRHGRSYVPFIKQVIHLNLMNNASDSDGTILEELHRLGMVIKSE